MEPQYSNMLQFKPIADAVDESISYIESRKNHTINPLKTRWTKFNKVCAGGIEPGMVFTVAGSSGSGKSSFVNTLETDLIDLNPGEDVIVLSISFEMLSYRQVTRKISNKLRRTTTELYSGEEDLSDDDFQKVKNVSQRIKNYPIYYVDTPGTVEEIESTIKYFHKNIAKGRWLVIILDHVLLVEGFDERKTIVDLQKMFIRCKKLFRTSIIQISQMNRNIESPERFNNPSLHYPMRSDLAASDAVYQASDFIIVLSRPELQNIISYGPNHLPVQGKVYLHFLKIRDVGEPCILQFDNNLKYGELIETAPLNNELKD